MTLLFVILTIINLLCLLGTAVLGYGNSVAPEWGSYHQLAGALATICCCAVHCVVFTYFIATAKWVRHAVLVKQLDESFAAPTRSFKAQAFPAALAAIAAVFAAAVFGAATDNRLIPTPWHHAAAIVSFGVNLAAAAMEYVAIGRNGRLIDRILTEVASPTT